MSIRRKALKNYPVPIYPARLCLIENDHGNARMTIDIPSLLPWRILWMSVGLSLQALSEAYNAAKEFLDLPSDASRPRYPWGDTSGEEGWYGKFIRDEDGMIHFKTPRPIIIGRDTAGDELLIARLSYNSPIDIDLIVGFATAFSLVGAIATGAITTKLKLLEWREKKKQLEDEDRKRDLEIEKLRLELEEKRTQIAQPVPVAQSPDVPTLPEPQMVMVQRLFFYGDFLAGKHEQILVDPAFR
jgi:hypothetical protein